MFIIENLLLPAEVNAILEAMEVANFDDIDSAVGSPARLQRSTNEPLQLDEHVISKIAHNHVFKNRVFPKRLSVPDFIRFSAGDSLSRHLEPVTRFGEQVLRRDCHVTIFLSGTEDYEGGELKLEWHGGTDKFRLAAGAALIVEPSAIIEVSQVTAGVCYRASVLCESLIRDPAMRSVVSSFSEVVQSIDAESDTHLKAEMALNGLLQLVVET